MELSARMRGILTYHSLDPSGSAISVDPAVFRHQVEWLASGRVRVVPLPDLLRLPPTADAIALTFDDGFANFAEVAAPLLRDYSLPATLFVVAGHVGGTNAWGGRRDSRVPTLPLLGWADLSRLADQGVRLGGHTRTHPHLTRVGPEALRDELGGAAETIRAETGRRPEEFAYPYGDVNQAVAAAAREIYTVGCTTELRWVRPVEDQLRLPRLDMYYLRAPGALEAWGTLRFTGGVWMRAQARRIRASLGTVGGRW